MVTEPNDQENIIGFRRQKLIIWAVFCVLSAGVFLVYVGSARAGDTAQPVMPLDDVYIHFQYARQIANGAPYTYNPDDSTTSGATSFLYPYLLAAGYRLGFQDLSLGLWAMFIGWGTLLASMWLIAHIVTTYGAPFWAGALTATIFGLSGSVMWHTMSGMETGLVICLTLAAILAFAQNGVRSFALAAALLALTRPEGSILALVFTSVRFITLVDRSKPLTSLSANRGLWWLAMPLIAVGIQPATNLLITGSVSAAGNQAKSILSIVPFDAATVIERILDNFLRMWRAFATGGNGLYTPLLIVPLALAGWLYLLRNRKFRGMAVALFVGTILVTLAISTLDTAFWHFRRYQMPVIAMFYPLAGLGGWWLWQILTQQQNIHYTLWPRYLTTAAVSIVMVQSVSQGIEFLRLHRVNVDNVLAQPYPMARWLAENTADDALIAVHDVGMMRYIGRRNTLDMVGLTTPDAADAWRNGPGSVAEFLLHHDPPPDYVAAYTTARGLNYLEDTRIYGELLAGFSAQYDPADNVALGAEFQGIFRYEASLSTHNPAPLVSDGVRVNYSTHSIDLNAILGTTPHDQIDVAHLMSETAHDYQWSTSTDAPGFMTEVYDQAYVNCDTSTAKECTRIDAGRRIDIEERFSLITARDTPALLVTRVHPIFAGSIDISIDGQWVDRQWIPAIPGQWLDIVTYIPADIILRDKIEVTIHPDVPGGYYMPYHHAIWPLPATSNDDRAIIDNPIAQFQDGSFSLHMIVQEQIDQSGEKQLWLTSTVQTDGTATGDYKFFVHLYNDPDASPILQADMYLADNTMPPGNWPPGVISDEIMLDLKDIPAGRYTLAVGFYDPLTFERLMPSLSNREILLDTAGRRIIVKDIEIEQDA
ncbi:MAG: hypothetical protein ACOCX5_02200 [Chloroflexota bacterium]